MAPAALTSAAATRSCPRANSPTRCRPSLALRSAESLDRQRMAMTSEAAVMSKPVSRAKPPRGRRGRRDAPQGPVVHVHDPLPGHVAPVRGRRGRRNGAGCRPWPPEGCGPSDGVDIAREMKVDLLAGHDLGLAAARGAPPFMPKTGPSDGSRRATTALLPDASKRPPGRWPSSSCPRRPGWGSWP